MRVEGKPLPVYGKGANVRDWLYVEDHARALELVLTGGAPRRELQCRRPRRSAPTSQVVETICDILDAKRPLGTAAAIAS